MKFAKMIGGLAIALLILVSPRICGVGAQQPPVNLVPEVTTDWVGCLVVGRNDPRDRISQNPFPTVERHVEMGLRSDGVVVWREASRAK